MTTLGRRSATLGAPIDSPGRKANEGARDVGSEIAAPASGVELEESKLNRASNGSLVTNLASCARECGFARPEERHANIVPGCPQYVVFHVAGQHGAPVQFCSGCHEDGDGS